ncbi:hypothetical protein E1211_30530 [Micromonospora sp. 15K316]|nr:hypothetical protein E1211_30530 [Micromonospora sp. 15K316]
MSAWTRPGRARRVGTRLVPPAPAPIEPLELGVDRDDKESPLLDVLLDYAPLIVVLALVPAGWLLARVVFG